MEQILTFEQLPSAVALLTKEISELKALLTEKQAPGPTEQPDELLDLHQAAKLLNLSTATVYSKVSKRELPVCKAGKKLHFLRSELLNYIRSGRKMTTAEITQQAEAYITKRR